MIIENKSGNKFRITEQSSTGYAEAKARVMVRDVIEYAKRNNLILILKGKEDGKE